MGRPGWAGCWVNPGEICPGGQAGLGGDRFINHAAVVYTLLCSLSGLCVSGVWGVGAAKASLECGRSWQRAQRHRFNRLWRTCCGAYLQRQDFIVENRLCWAQTGMADRCRRHRRALGVTSTQRTCSSHNVPLLFANETPCLPAVIYTNTKTQTLGTQWIQLHIHTLTSENVKCDKKEEILSTISPKGVTNEYTFGSIV